MHVGPIDILCDLVRSDFTSVMKKPQDIGNEKEYHPIIWIPKHIYITKYSDHKNLAIFISP